eukprot:TRINITY_DN5893_c0_g1_i1.p1 TRINITY_DN5893_c0_g1~~TRINITY_DN5893_c0_g1_i1.p1  ORF type:complete len:227 (-),score=101.09 TRINITY_DN5893_c0_g1_i1:19-699(-)
MKKTHPSYSPPPPPIRASAAGASEKSKKPTHPSYPPPPPPPTQKSEAGFFSEPSVDFSGNKEISTSKRDTIAISQESKEKFISSEVIPKSKLHSNSPAVPSSEKPVLKKERKDEKDEKDESQKSNDTLSSLSSEKEINKKPTPESIITETQTSFTAVSSASSEVGNNSNNEKGSLASSESDSLSKNSLRIAKQAIFTEHNIQNKVTSFEKKKKDVVASKASLKTPF